MITCDLCPAQTSTVATAIEAGWMPGYYVGDEAHERDAICGDCADSKCRIGDDGELELKPIAIQPIAISDYGRYLPPKQLFS